MVRFESIFTLEEDAMTQESNQGGMWQVTCQCGWRTRGTTKQVVSTVQEHGRSVHQMEITEEQVMALAVPE